MILVLDLAALLAFRSTIPVRWTRADVIAYMHGISAGLDVTAPPSTFAAALARNVSPRIDTLGGSYDQTVLACHALTIHNAIRWDGEAIAQSRIRAIEDRGADRGAMIAVETLLIAIDGAPIASVVAGLLARADGGCGSIGTIPSRRSPPTRPADTELTLTVRPDQALLYSRSGDTNPLHLDEDVARERGFDAPILHGLCTYAFAARAIAQVYGDGDPAQVIDHEAYFTGPVFPGETLRVKLWQTADGISFEAFSVERAVKVLAGGHSLLAGRAESLASSRSERTAN